MLALILLAGLRAHTEFATDNPLTWLFLDGFLTALVGLSLLSLRIRPDSLMWRAGR
jgi:hypothetical protein